MCIKASAVYLVSCISRISYLLKSLILSLSVAQLRTANACSVLIFALCSHAAFCGHHAFAASKQMNWKTSRWMDSGILYSFALHLSHPTDSLPVEYNIWVGEFPRMHLHGLFISLPFIRSPIIILLKTKKKMTFSLPPIHMNYVG